MNNTNKFTGKLILIILVLGIAPLRAFSQEQGSCAEKLKMAQSLFDKGQVSMVPDLLDQCLRSGFSREESLSAYKLIIQSFLFEENQSKADSTMLEFLKKTPEYQLSPTDHSTFVYLFNIFRVKPVVKISLHFGTNVPFITGIVKNGVSGNLDINTYTSQLMNLYGSVEATFTLTSRLELNVEAGYSSIAFTNKREIYNIGTTSYIENQRRFELPLTATYDIKSFNKFILYGRAGGGPAISLGVTATPEFVPSDINGIPKTGSDIDRSDSRISMDFFGQVAAGIKYKTRGGFIFAEFRSNIGILNQVIRAGASAREQELQWHYYYEDNDFHLNNMNFNIGYTIIFYKPSKK